MPRIAAAAVSMIGRSRWSAASTTASQASASLRPLVLDLVDQDHRIADDHAGQRDDAERGDEAHAACLDAAERRRRRSARAAPRSAPGTGGGSSAAGSSARSASACSIRGTGPTIEACALPLSSTVPPSTMRNRPAGLACSASISAPASCTTVGGWHAGQDVGLHGDRGQAVAAPDDSSHGRIRSSRSGAAGPGARWAAGSGGSRAISATGALRPRPARPRRRDRSNLRIWVTVKPGHDHVHGLGELAAELRPAWRTWSWSTARRTVLALLAPVVVDVAAHRVGGRRIWATFRRWCAPRGRSAADAVLHRPADGRAQLQPRDAGDHVREIDRPRPVPAWP